MHDASSQDLGQQIKHGVTQQTGIWTHIARSLMSSTNNISMTSSILLWTMLKTWTARTRKESRRSKFWSQDAPTSTSDICRTEAAQSLLCLLNTKDCCPWVPQPTKLYTRSSMRVRDPWCNNMLRAWDVVLRSFSLGKLLSHHSAAFSPTLVQRSQGQILSLLEGKLQQSNYHFLAPFGANIPAALAHRRQLRQPVHRHDTDAAVVHKHKLRKQQDRWKLHLRLKPRKHVLKVKRHVFRKRKKPLPVLRPQRK